MEYQQEKELSDREFAILQSELSQHRKSTVLAYLLWFFLGWIGVHQFYIGKILRGMLYVGLCLGGWIFTALSITSDFVTVLPSILFGTLGVFWLVDLFTIPSQIDKVRSKKKSEILRELKNENKFDF